MMSCKRSEGNHSCCLYVYHSCMPVSQATIFGDGTDVHCIHSQKHTLTLGNVNHSVSAYTFPKEIVLLQHGTAESLKQEKAITHNLIRQPIERNGYYILHYAHRKQQDKEPQPIHYEYGLLRIILF